MRWEYKVLRIVQKVPSDQEATLLNALGTDGWELTSTILDPATANTYHYLKRPVDGEER